MGKFTLFIIVVFLIVLGYFATLNKDSITLIVSPSITYEMPKVALILLASAAGAAVMLIIFFIRDTKRFIHNRQYYRKQKKETKVQELYSRALNAILADNKEEAKAALEGILKEDPVHLDALLRLGDIFADNEDYQAALDYYKRANEIQPQNIEVKFSLEKVMEKTGRMADALLYMDEILGIDPDNLAALYRKRSVLERKDEWDELIDLQKTIIKCEHNEKNRQREQANLLGYKYEQGRNSLENNSFENAGKAFKGILKLDKDFVPAYLGLAEAMLREAESEDVIDFLEKGFEQTASMIILARLEDLLISLGEPARLIRIYKSSIARDLQNQGLRFLLGKLYYRLEMLDDAFEVLTTLDAAGAPYPEVHQLMGNIYVRHQQWNKALEEYRKVIEINKTARLPYVCTSCGYLDMEWAGRCRKCRDWNTYGFNLLGNSTA